MDIKAKARYIRMSPRKIRLVVDVIRGMRALDAKMQLKFMNKLAAMPVLKLLDSAIANAQNNFQLDSQNLYVKEIVADQGPTLKRWRPRAFGRATPIRKRTTHISLILGEAVEAKKTSDSVKQVIKKDARKKAQTKE